MCYHTKVTNSPVKNILQLWSQVTELTEVEYFGGGIASSTV